MSKTEVYSWRVDPKLKRRLEDAARAANLSVAAVIDKACRVWLETEPVDEVDRKEQARLNGVLQSIIEEARRSDPGGPPTPSATNENLRKAFAEKHIEDQKRRNRDSR